VLDDGACSDYGSITNSNPPEDAHSSPDPHIGTNPDWCRHARLLVYPPLGTNSMVVIGNETAWRNHSMVSHYDTFADVEFGS
jgi:hypothetical protein